MIEAQPTHVVHLLSSLPKEGVYRKSQYDATNLIRTRGTANVIRGALAAGAKRIVAESFPLVYGVREQTDALLREDSPLEPIKRGPSSEAVAALRSLESQVLAVRGRIDAVVLRYGYIYGPSIDFTRVMFERLRERKLPVMRGMRGIGSFIHIDDAVEATIAALERGSSGIFNVVDDEPASLSDFFAYAVQLIGAKPPMRVPRFLLKIVAPVIVDLSTAQLPLSNAKSKRELVFTPRYPSFRDGLREAAAEVLTAA
jgi:nucleoside-diphosphate-sugar epimerase